MLKYQFFVRFASIFHVSHKIFFCPLPPKNEAVAATAFELNTNNSQSESKSERIMFVALTLNDTM